MSEPVGIKYKRLKQSHPRVDQKRLRIFHALYKGGHHLLNDREVMSTVFPKYTYEQDSVYNERCRRAFYENLFGLVVNQMSAGLAQDPAQALPKSTEVGATIGDYWKSLWSCATAYDEDGSEQRSFDQVMRDLAVEAMSCGWSWIQIELPKSDGTANSRADQESAGDLDAYLCSWPTDQIVDWEEQDGVLLWLRTYECKTSAPTPADDRTVKRHVWTVWDDEMWYEYVVEEWTDLSKPGAKPLPNDEDMIPVANSDPHSFGRVPWIRLDFCCPGTYLHIGDFIASACVAYFNRVNGENFQWTQYNFQQLYEFLGPENPGIDNDVSEAQKDPQRAVRRVRAPGQVHVRGREDEARFVGPDMGGAEAGRQATQDMRDGILRMIAQMALSQDTSGAMLRRSGDSKAQDSQAQEILLGAIGSRLLTAAKQIVALIAYVREEDEDEDTPNVEGYQKFNVDSLMDLVTMMIQLAQVTIPSRTDQIESKHRLAIAVLGDDVSDEIKTDIHTELEEAITQEAMDWMMQPQQPAPSEDGSGEMS